MIKWRKNPDGLYESDLTYYDENAREIRPLYMIVWNGYHHNKCLLVKCKTEKIFYGSGGIKIVKDEAEKLEAERKEKDRPA